MLIISSSFSYGRPEIKFVHLFDTHVSSSTGADDLRRTVNNINHDASIQFVGILGDISSGNKTCLAGTLKNVREFKLSDRNSKTIS